MKQDKLKKGLQYRPVKGFEDLYLVSEEGDIWSIRAKKHISLDNNGCGYYLFIACRKGQRTVRLVHRVVAQAFIGPIGEDQQVNHKKDKQNNAYWNLQILTHQEHGRFHRGRNNGNYGRKKTKEEIKKRTLTRKQRRLERMKNG